MKKTALWILMTVCAAIAVNAQNTQPPAYAVPVDPVGSIAIDLANISKSVQTLNATLKSFVDKFEKAGGLTFTEKQQKLVLALEFLVRAEERLAILQRNQVELVDKQSVTRSRLAQVERDLYPQSIDRSVAFEGTTRAEEMRESKRATLAAERQTLQALLSQINGNLSETGEAVREAELLVRRLRRQYLPQIEREIFEQSN
jgi:uncharacterized protein YoxC